MKPSRWIQLFAGLLIAAAGLWIFFKDVSAASLLRELSKGNPLGIMGAVALGIAAIWLRALRWALMLPSPEGSHKKGLFALSMIGFMVNNILPARAGEAVRALLLWRRNRFPGATAIGSLIVERGIDTLVFLSFFFVPVFILFGTKRMFDVTLPLSIVFGAGVLFFAVYAVIPEKVRAGLLLLCGMLPPRLRDRLRALILDAFSNLEWLFSPGRAAAVAALSFAVNLCYAAALVILAASPGSFGIPQGMFASALAALGAAIPLAPGYVGTLHASLKYGLTLMGISDDRAAALAIIYHAVGYLPVTLLGLYFFFKTDLRFRDITKARETVGSIDTKGS